MFVRKYERNTISSVSNNFTSLTLLGYDILLLYSNQCVQIFARKIYQPFMIKQCHGMFELQMNNFKYLFLKLFYDY